MPGDRQLKRRGGTRQLLAPVRHLFLEHFSLQPFSLPASKISVLDGKPWQINRALVNQALVNRGQLAHQYSSGPAVTDDVVHSEQQHMILGA